MNTRHASATRTSAVLVVASLFVLFAAVVAFLLHGASGTPPDSTLPPIDQPAPHYYRDEPSRLSEAASTPQVQPAPPPSTAALSGAPLDPDIELDSELDDDHHPSPTSDDEPNDASSDNDHQRDFGDDNHEARRLGDGRTHIWRWLT
jgi:hypothetical protein